MKGPEYVELADFEFTLELIRCVPGTLARRYELLPVALRAGQLWVALARPAAPALLAEIRRELKRDVYFCVAKAEHVRCLLAHFYGQS